MYGIIETIENGAKMSKMSRSSEGGELLGSGPRQAGLIVSAHGTVETVCPSCVPTISPQEIGQALQATLRASSGVEKIIMECIRCGTSIWAKETEVAVATNTHYNNGATDDVERK